MPANHRADQISACGRQRYILRASRTTSAAIRTNGSICELRPGGLCVAPSLETAMHENRSHPTVGIDDDIPGGTHTSTSGHGDIGDLARRPGDATATVAAQATRGPRLRRGRYLPPTRRPGGHAILDEAEVQRYCDMADAFIASIPPYPADRFSGRGIVICGGGAYFTCAWVTINVLRHLGCELPVEIWCLDDTEITDEMVRLVEPLDVTCRNAADVRLEYPVRRLQGWELKPYAIIHSRFEDVLFLDADNVPVVDPAFLFETPQYRHDGAIFWSDYGQSAPDRTAWHVFGVPYRDKPDFESGQIVVNKVRCWNPLNLTMHYNEHSDYYYRFVHGDKDTFHMAWRRLGVAYAMPSRGVWNLGDKVMCQHDFTGNRVFQHRNQAKWKLPPDRNRRIEGFQLEPECLGFLEVLI